jgi:hypothetical protein
MHGVHKTTFYNPFKRTVTAINEVYADVIRFPWGDIPALQQMWEEFFVANGYSLDGCTLAVDGITIKIHARFGILWRNLKFDQKTNVEIIRACMRIHNLAIDDAERPEDAERDSREALSGVMDDESLEVQRTSGQAMPDYIRYRNVERPVERPPGQGRGRRTDLENDSVRMQVTIALRGKNRPPPRTVGAQTARAQARGVFGNVQEMYK